MTLALAQVKTAAPCRFSSSEFEMTSVIAGRSRPTAVGAEFCFFLCRIGENLPGH
jgi:hypothetical protein